MTNAQKLLLGAIGTVVLIAFALGVTGFVRGLQSSRNSEPSGEAAVAFQEELTSRALARGPHPIEGFDASMLLDVFPGLEERDFDGVETGLGSMEGLHAYMNGELRWERAADQPVTSAERTVSRAGYATLLQNLSRRLGMPASSPREAIAIAEEIDIPADLAEHIISKRDLIRAFAPRPLSIIGSPLTVWGEARGTWYFEADFQLTLVDWDGRIIAESYATAQSDWMTAEFVPFEGTIEFEDPSDEADFSKRGTLILRKANPSGLPENDDALEIPVLFK